MKRVRFTSLALQDVDKAARFYEGRKEGLGEEFYEQIDDAVSRIGENPEGYRNVFRELRRCTLRKFRDFALWFEVMSDRSVVVACLSSRRSPELVKQRGANILRFPDPS